MHEFTPLEICGLLLGVATAINSVGGAIEKVAKGIKSAKAPNEAQNKRIDALEEWKKGDFEAWKKTVDTKLQHDHERFESIDSSNRVTQRALLALLNHGIDGNNVKQMQDAMDELHNHLINHH